MCSRARCVSCLGGTLKRSERPETLQIWLESSIEEAFRGALVQCDAEMNRPELHLEQVSLMCVSPVFLCACHCAYVYVFRLLVSLRVPLLTVCMTV